PQRRCTFDMLTSSSHLVSRRMRQTAFVDGTCGDLMPGRGVGPASRPSERGNCGRAALVPGVIAHNIEKCAVGQFCGVVHCSPSHLIRTDSGLKPGPGRERSIMTRTPNVSSTARC